MKTYLVTGGAGFIGSNFVLYMLKKYEDIRIINLDKLTYAGNLENLKSIQDDPRHIFVHGDICDNELVKSLFEKYEIDYVAHFAAESHVDRSIREPEVFAKTNVMGTVNILEAVRQTKSVKSFLNVTTDKVYKNNEWEWGYREIDELDGYDPYSNSKSCSELVTHSYEKSFLKEAGVAVSTARAGNVIGGGDFAPDRIIPDCVRAVAKGEKIAVRNPHSTRPYQHVLEPLGAYLMIAQAQYENPACAGSYNVGPGDEDCITTGQLADLFCNSWGGEAAWENLYQGGPHEANFLKLDCSKIRTAFGWKPHWQVAQAVKETAVWYQAWLEGKDMEAFTDEQIRKYFTLQERK